MRTTALDPYVLGCCNFTIHLCTVCARHICSLMGEVELSSRHFKKWLIFGQIPFSVSNDFPNLWPNPKPKRYVVWNGAFHVWLAISCFTCIRNFFAVKLVSEVERDATHTSQDDDDKPKKCPSIHDHSLHGHCPMERFETTLLLSTTGLRQINEKWNKMLTSGVLSEQHQCFRLAGLIDDLLITRFPKTVSTQ